MHAPRSASAFAGGVAVAYALDAARRIICLRSALPLISEDAPIQWVHVAYEGEWHGHPSGSFALTREGFEQAVSNAERQKNPGKLDFDHETDFLATGSSVPARGYVHRLQIRDDERGIAHLWALIEFGEEAVAKNRAGGYRFCSGVFFFDATDRVTGEPIGLFMPRVALTDDPFLDGQTPIRLSRAAGVALGDQSMKIKKSDFLSRLRKIEGDEVTVEQLTKLAQSMGLLDEAMSGGSAEEPAAEAAELAAGDADKDKVTASATEPAPEAVAAAAPAPEAPPADPAMAEADSLAAQIMEASGMDLAALIEALKAMAGGGQETAATLPLSTKLKEQAQILSAHVATIAALSARVESAEAKVATYLEAEADAAVSVLVAEGRLLDNARSEMRALYLSNRKAFDSIGAGLPELVPVGQHASKDAPPTVDSPAINEDDPQVKSLRRTLGNTWLRNDKAKQDEAIRKRLAAKNNGARV